MCHFNTGTRIPHLTFIMIENSVYYNETLAVESRDPYEPIAQKDPEATRTANH
jgi:hypothetical protein